MNHTDHTDELPCLLALLHVPGLGIARRRELLKRFGTAVAILDSVPEIQQEQLLPPTVLKYLKEPDWSQVEVDLRWAHQSGNSILTSSDLFYPYLLSQIHDPPPLLFVSGDPDALNKPQIALVGSREPSPAAYDIAYEFGRELAAAGVLVTSGMARGIDSAGHEGALEGGGQTIMVAATGLDRVYPASQHKLAQRIASSGALVSEYPPGSPPHTAHFIQRTRIISGLSTGVLVIEAGLKSGSLITARLALEQGREVFTIPGSIKDPKVRGCHVLLRNGAKLVENVQDILEDVKFLAPGIKPHAKRDSNKNSLSLDQDYCKILEFLGYDPIFLDDLVDKSGLPPSSVSSMLLILELHGMVSAHPGGLYALNEKSPEHKSRK